MNANEIIKAGLQFEVKEIDGIGPVQIRALKWQEADQYTKFLQKTDDTALGFAFLVKLCCPAFKAFWWTPRRIRNKLAFSALLAIASEIMTLSGYSETGVTDAKKD